MVILADSHGRHLGDKIEQRCSTNITSFVRPGAKFNEVIKEVEQLSKNLSLNDHLLVIGGTNNMERGEEVQLMKEIKTLIKLTSHTNLILATIPLRYDMAHLDMKIISANSKLEEVTENHSNVSLLPLHLLTRQYFTQHGLHLNKKGKDNVSQMIAKIIMKKENISNEPILCKKLIPHQEEINVIDGDMHEILEDMENNPSVGFAHTISADIEHPRNMTGGVAVIFRKKFGRPNFSDYIDGKLTKQKIPNGASIFSLVTKHNYYGKPSHKDYIRSFNQLTKNFTKANLKILVCTPMGCVRDNVELDLFAKKIVDFQNKTNAKIFIVSYNQESHRILRGGLSHPDFLENLKEKIELEKIKSSNSGETHYLPATTTQEESTAEIQNEVQPMCESDFPTQDLSSQDSQPQNSNKPNIINLCQPVDNFLQLMKTPIVLT